MEITSGWQQMHPQQVKFSVPRIALSCSFLWLTLGRFSFMFPVHHVPVSEGYSHPPPTSLGFRVGISWDYLQSQAMRSNPCLRKEQCWAAQYLEGSWGLLRRGGREGEGPQGLPGAPGPNQGIHLPSQVPCRSWLAQVWQLLEHFTMAKC